MPYTPAQRFWYFLNQLNRWDERHKVLSSLGVKEFKFLSVEKQLELTDQLEEEWKQRSKKPRNAVIYYLCVMPNYTYTLADKPDYEKINAWVATKFDGKKLYQLSLNELNTAVTAVKRWYEKELKTENEIQ